MSWDVFVMGFPHNIETPDQIPDDFKLNPPRIGSRSELIALIREIVPTADFTDPSFGQIRGPGYSMNVHMGDDEEVDGFTFVVRGNSDVPANIVAEVLTRTGLRAIETGTGGFFDPKSAVAGLQAWRAYRDYVLAGVPKEGLSTE